MKWLDYLYNGVGQRVSQEASSVITEYLLDTQPGLAKVIASKTGGNTTRFVHDPMGIHSQENPNGDWLHMVKDGLGSVRQVFDDNLSELYAAEYAPYGEVWNSSGTEQTPFAFTGEMLDDNGLQYHRARYLDPSLGVWMSLDLLETPNLYGYVSGNSVNMIDPSGLSEYCLPNTVSSLLPAQQRRGNCGADPNAINNLPAVHTGQIKYLEIVQRDKEYFLAAASRRHQELRRFAQLESIRMGSINYQIIAQTILSDPLPNYVNKLENMSDAEFAAQMASVPGPWNANGWWGDFTATNSTTDIKSIYEAYKNSNGNFDPGVATRQVTAIQSEAIQLYGRPIMPYLATRLLTTRISRFFTYTRPVYVYEELDLSEIQSAGFLELRYSELENLISGLIPGTHPISPVPQCSSASECFDDYVYAHDRSSPVLAELTAARFTTQYLQFMDDWATRNQSFGNIENVDNYWRYMDPLVYAIECSKAGYACEAQGTIGAYDSPFHDDILRYTRWIFGSTETDCVLKPSEVNFN